VCRGLAEKYEQGGVRVAAARRRHVVTSALVLCTLAAGCTGPAAEAPGSSPGTSSASASPSDPPAEPVTLTFAVYGSRGSVAAYDELARAFTKNNPRITVEVERAPDVTDAMASYEQAYAEGNPPDVFLVDHDHLPALVEQDMVQPVDGLLEERDLDFGDGYQRDGLESFAASDALQCMPHDVSPTVVYYNKDLVDLTRLVEEGETPPNAEDGWTWEEFSLAARQASRVKGKGVYIEPTLRALAPFVWSAGADIVDDVQDPTTLTLSEGDTREALEEVLALVRDPLVTPTRAELAEEDALSRFRQGRLGMILGTRALTPTLRAQEDLDFDVMPLPSLGRFRTVSDMTGYCISSGPTRSRQQATSWPSRSAGRVPRSPRVTATSCRRTSGRELGGLPAGVPARRVFIFNEYGGRSRCRSHGQPRSPSRSHPTWTGCSIAGDRPGTMLGDTTPTCPAARARSPGEFRRRVANPDTKGTLGPGGGPTWLRSRSRQGASGQGGPSPKLPPCSWRHHRDRRRRRLRTDGGRDPERDFMLRNAT
jgi:multiple sugar transport system substrate-binding protein